MNRTRIGRRFLRWHRRRRRGAALMFALIAVVVVTASGAVLLRAMLIETRQSRIEEWSAQADWLVEAAADRAAAVLASDAGYVGETWQVDAAELDGRHAAEAQIAVTQSADEADTKRVAVTARHPVDASVFITRRQTFNVSVHHTDTPSGEDAS